MNAYHLIFNTYCNYLYTSCFWRTVCRRYIGANTQTQISVCLYFGKLSNTDQGLRQLCNVKKEDTYMNCFYETIWHRYTYSDKKKSTVVSLKKISFLHFPYNHNSYQGGQKGKGEGSFSLISFGDVKYNQSATISFLWVEIKFTGS